MGKPLPKSFYARRTKRVAQELIGKILVHKMRSGREARCVITETEAYLGVEDRAAHTFAGRRTVRTETMWGDAGHAYIYFIYGMYYCLNVVTEKAGVPEAVLIRGARPLETDEQIQIWSQIEPDRRKWPKLLAGPGKLCRALQIDKKLNGADLINSELFIEQGFPVKTKMILKTRRIGIDYAGDAKEWPLRFFWNSGRLYESLFQHHKNHRKNTTR